MFLNTIKNFFINISLKKEYKTVKNLALPKTIKTVGVLFDENYFREKNAFINELSKHKIEEKNISFLAFRDTITNTESFDYPIFSYADISVKGTFLKPEIERFINTPFDLLIDYYELEKPPLLKVSLQSKAMFKVGFQSVNQTLHRLIIATSVKNYKLFIQELFKYLKLLNKI